MTLTQLLIQDAQDIFTLFSFLICFLTNWFSIFSCVFIIPQWAIVWITLWFSELWVHSSENTVHKCNFFHVVYLGFYWGPWIIGKTARWPACKIFWKVWKPLIKILDLHWKMSPIFVVEILQVTILGYIWNELTFLVWFSWLIISWCFS